MAETRGCTVETFMDLLELFTFETPEVDAADVQHRLGIGKSTAHRLIRSLCRESILVKGASPHTYKLGFSLLSFGETVISRYDINNKEVYAVLQDLVLRTGETGYIATMHGTEIVYIQKIDCDQPIRLLSYLGKISPAYCTSSGRAILAYQPEETIRAVVEKGFYPYTERTVRTADQLYALLEQARKDGVVVGVDEYNRGITSIGVPIFNDKGVVHYSVSIVGPNRRFTKDKLPGMIKHVKEASETIRAIMSRRQQQGLTVAAESPPPPVSGGSGWNPDDVELKTVSNALRILRLFSVHHPEWGVREIARQLNLSKTTAHRLIAALASRGYLEKVPQTGRYRLGIRWLTLSGFITTQEEMYREALPVLRWLVRESGETVLMGVLENGEVNYIHKVDCPNPTLLRSAVGRRHPVHCTASGQVMLAFRTNKEIDGFLRRTLPRFTEHTIVDPDRLRERLRLIREVGYAVSVNEIYEGVVSIAVPIRDYSDRVTASLAIVGSTARITDEKIPMLIEKASVAGGRISEKLGYYGPPKRAAIAAKAK